MKKKISALLIALMVIYSATFTAFAEPVNEAINSVSELKKELADAQSDGELTDSEKTYLTNYTDEEVIDSFVEEKFDEAVSILNNENCTMADGVSYEKKIYQMEDGCQLIVELEDCAEDENSGMQSRATSGSNTLWKAYGNRYFTAKATVAFGIGTASLQLQNHYILSKKGIDENYGTSAVAWSTTTIGEISKGTPTITDSAARTVGASDVNMHCYYTLTSGIQSGSPVTVKYKMATTVGFVDIDTDEGKVKVKQSWKLTKV